MSLLINEIFFSIQGESLNAGRPCIFIRLTGCNLRCTYCDTTYAYSAGEKKSIPEILRQIETFDCGLVEITGGEPLLQDGTPALALALLEAGREVMIETNGSLDVSPLDSRCMKIVDMKCPSSGASSENRMENLSALTPRDQVKFVIGNPEDYEFAKSSLDVIPEKTRRDHILFSPVAGRLSLDTMAEWILRDRLGVRLHSQLHKFIWPDDLRGR